MGKNTPNNGDSDDYVRVTLKSGVIDYLKDVLLRDQRNNVLNATEILKYLRTVVLWCF